MTKIHVNRDRQNLGQFSAEEVAAGLANGRFLATDLAWREGMETWLPLATFTDLPAAAAVEETAPILAPGSEEIVPPVAGPAEPAWERRDEIGYASAVFSTIRQVITDPIVTFRLMKKSGGLLVPFIFFYALQICCGLIGVLESLAWERVLPANLLAQAADKTSESAMLSNPLFTVPVMFISGLVLPFISSGIYFVAARLLTKKPVPFEVLFRTYCYLAGSLAILNVVPVPPIPFVSIPFVFFLGVIVMTYQVIAIREAAALSTLEAAGVVFLPILLCCFCVLAAGGMVGLAAFPALQNMTH